VISAPIKRSFSTQFAKSGHTRTAWRTGQIDPLLPSKIGPANGMEARESGLRLKAWRCTRGGYSATAARLPLKDPRPVASGSSPGSALAHHARRTGPGGGGSARVAGSAARTRTGRASNIWPTASPCARAPTKHEPHGFSIERILLLVQSNCRLVGFLLRTLGFGGTVGANKYFAFRFRHPEKINQLVEAGRDRHEMRG
jgi:hypothetical protein